MCRAGESAGDCVNSVEVEPVVQPDQTNITSVETVVSVYVSHRRFLVVVCVYPAANNLVAGTRATTGHFPTVILSPPADEPASDSSDEFTASMEQVAPISAQATSKIPSALLLPSAMNVKCSVSRYVILLH
jgi:hypothetical protein